MPIKKFSAFYPSRPFWAGSKVNFLEQSHKDWFHDQMAEEVFSKETDTYSIKVCRDGMIMLRIEDLEQGHDSEDCEQPEKAVKRWGKYLDYLNAFYLLFDSATIEIDRLGHFNLHEITNRDAFRMQYEDDKLISAGIASESITSVFQMGRFSSSYPSGLPIEYSLQIMQRQIISIKAIEHAHSSFAKVVATPGLEKILASFAKSLSEYKVGNYETSIVLSWFIAEAVISHLWEMHVDGMNSDFTGGSKRINKERRRFLTGHDFTISMVSNLLELWGVLPYDQFQDIDAVRGFRNKIVHGHNFTPRPNEALLAMETAQGLINRRWEICFTPNMSYSVHGL